MVTETNMVHDCPHYAARGELVEPPAGFDGLVVEKM